MGESPSSLGRQGENAPYLLFNYRFIAWSVTPRRVQEHLMRICQYNGGLGETEQGAPICLQGITVAHA